MWRSRTRIVPPCEERRLRDFRLLAAVAFGLLFVLAYRFIIDAVPLATLALLRSMQAAVEAPGRFARLPARGRVPLTLAFALCLVSTVPLARLGLGRMQA